MTETRQSMTRADEGGETPLLGMSRVSLRLGGQPVLENVSLAVGAGEIVTLIGPNGSGKTTLARVALGLVTPDAGTVQRDPGLRIGYVPQRLTIDNSLPLTVTRFLFLRGGVSGEEILAALEKTGVAGLSGAQLHGLSGGEMRRVLLARALLGRPALLVLDEPASGVDIKGQSEVYDLIRRLRDSSGCGILLISHDLHLVMAAADRVLCLNKHICCSGEPEAVSRHPDYLKLFNKTEAEALAIYQHDHDHEHAPSGEVVDSEPGR